MFSLYDFPLLRLPEPKHLECALCWPLLNCECNELAPLTCSLGADRYRDHCKQALFAN